MKKEFEIEQAVEAVVRDSLLAAAFETVRPVSSLLSALIEAIKERNRKRRLKYLEEVAITLQLNGGKLNTPDELLESTRISMIYRGF
ncbi:MAG: hypothetical protein GY866_19605 [Proteobacteria bacterium]|nr:hypothetical protein [Pseudomonadota bacterium]